MIKLYNDDCFRLNIDCFKLNSRQYDNAVIVVGLLPKDVTIVDPFMGSGTTGVAVVEMNKEQEANRSFVGVEISKQYYEIARKRIREK